MKRADRPPCARCKRSRGTYSGPVEDGYCSPCRKFVKRDPGYYDRLAAKYEDTPGPDGILGQVGFS